MKNYCRFVITLSICKTDFKKLIQPDFTIKFYTMRRGRRKSSPKKNRNQLTLDFNVNVPIEIHIPKYGMEQVKKELTWDRKTAIELVRS